MGGQVGWQATKKGDGTRTELHQ